jgi:hypothetical protein
MQKSTEDGKRATMQMLAQFDRIHEHDESFKTTENQQASTQG